MKKKLDISSWSTYLLRRRLVRCVRWIEVVEQRRSTRASLTSIIIVIGDAVAVVMLQIHARDAHQAAQAVRRSFAGSHGPLAHWQRYGTCRLELSSFCGVGSFSLLDQASTTQRRRFNLSNAQLNVLAIWSWRQTPVVASKWSSQPFVASGAPVTINVIEAELLDMRQAPHEQYLAFTSHVQGKAEACIFLTNTTCSDGTVTAVDDSPDDEWRDVAPRRYCWLESMMPIALKALKTRLFSP